VQLLDEPHQRKASVDAALTGVQSLRCPVAPRPIGARACPI